METDNSFSRPVDFGEENLLEELRFQLKQNDDVKNPMDDIFLLRCLRHKKGDVKKTIDSIKHQYKLESKYPELFQGLYETFARHFPSNFYTVLRNRDSLGRQIALVRMKYWDPSISPFELFTFQICLSDLITSRQLTQLNGLVAIFDMEGLTLEHVKHMTPSLVRTVLEFLHKVPLRLKGLHIVNNPAIFNVVWYVAKMLLKPKMKKRIHFHGYKLESLHDHISPKILPKCYGGVLEDDEFEELNLMEQVEERKDFIVDSYNLKKYGVVTK